MNADERRRAERSGLNAEATIMEDLQSIAESPAREQVTLLLHHRNGVAVAQLERGTSLCIGRSAEAEICIDDRSLSRKHARVSYDGEIWIEDLGSTNGTWVGRQRVQRARLGIGETAQVGAVALRVSAVRADESHLYGLASHDQFLSALEDEVDRTRTFRRCLGVLVLRPADRGRLLPSDWCAPLRQLLRPVDKIALYASDTVEILVPETGREGLLEVARKLLRKAEESEVKLLCGGALHPDSADSAAQLLDAGLAALTRASERSPLHLAPDTVTRDVTTSNDLPRGGGPVVRSPAMTALYEMIGRIADSTLPVLVLGETGSGKEVVARELHDRSPRSAKPLICVNCGAIPEPLLESTLFGHERGAFTGALAQSRGVFESAEGGSVFLDEIGELTPKAQAALLRVLETRRVSRVGSSKELAVNTRVIAATHRDLERMCEEGTFRSDLLFRLNALTLKVPALRHRPEEILPLAQYFMAEAARENGRPVQRFEEAAAEALLRYRWPGNVRELRNVIDRAVLIAQGSTVALEDLSERVRLGPLARGVSGLQAADSTRRRVLSEAVRGDELDKSDAPPWGPAEGLPGLAAPARREVRPTLAIPPTAGRRPLDGEDRTLVNESRPGEPAEGEGRFWQLVGELERELIVEALAASGWSRTTAAEALKMPLRTLRHKMKAFGLDTQEAVATEPKVLAQVPAAVRREGLPGVVAWYEAKLLREALERAGGNRSAVSRTLGIPRRTLLVKIQDYNLDDE